MSHYQKFPMLALFAAGFLAANGVAAQNLTLAVQGVPDSLDPVTENSNLNLRVVSSIYETLIDTNYRDGGALEPGLATNWEVLDARTIEFELRDGVRFHNGDTLDASDVVATFDPVRRGQDDSVPVASRQFLSGIDRVEVVDNMTVRIHMSEPDSIAVNRFASFPSHIISSDAFEAADTYTEFAAQAIGTGPYRVEEHEIGEQVVLERFDEYWGEPEAAAEQLTFTVVPELSTRIAGLFSGQFDVITEIGADEIAQIEGNAETSIVGGPIESIRGLFYDSTNSTLDDPRIRRALNLSIDRQLLVESFYQGKTPVPNGWQMDIFGEMYLDDRPKPEYNVDKAQRLLEEAGYNGDEIVYRTLPNYYPKQLETAQALQSMWNNAGLNVTLEVKENWSQAKKDDERRHIIDGSFTAYYPDPMGQFWRRFGPDSGKEDDYWVNSPEMLELGETLATSVDTDQRRQTFRRMLNRFEMNPHGAVLHTLPMFMGIRSDRLSMDPVPSEQLDLTTDGLTFKR